MPWMTLRVIEEDLVSPLYEFPRFSSEENTQAGEPVLHCSFSPKGEKIA